jgi:hypothetical protein
VQRPPHGSGKRTGYAHRIILLQPCNGVAHFLGEHTVDWSAIIAQPAQGCLHRSNISRIQNELVAALKVVHPSPGISGRKISRVHVRRLMSGSPLVPLSKRIDGSKDTIIDNVKLVALRDRCAQPDNQNECYSFHKVQTFNACLCPREDQAAASLAVYRSPFWGSLDTQPDRVPDQNVCCCSPTFAAADKDPASSRSPLDT